MKMILFPVILAAYLIVLLVFAWFLRELYKIGSKKEAVSSSPVSAHPGDDGVWRIHYKKGEDWEPGEFVRHGSKRWKEAWDMPGERLHHPDGRVEEGVQ
jgi:hypothetical protein